MVVYVVDIVRFDIKWNIRCFVLPNQNTQPAHCPQSEHVLYGTSLAGQHAALQTSGTRVHMMYLPNLRLQHLRKMSLHTGHSGHVRIVYLIETEPRLIKTTESCPYGSAYAPGTRLFKYRCHWGKDIEGPVVASASLERCCRKLERARRRVPVIRQFWPKARTTITPILSRLKLCGMEIPQIRSQDLRPFASIFPRHTDAVVTSVQAQPPPPPQTSLSPSLGSNLMQDPPKGAHSGSHHPMFWHLTCFSPREIAYICISCRTRRTHRILNHLSGLTLTPSSPPPSPPRHKSKQTK